VSGRATVVIADDHPLMAQGLRALLRPGYQVVAVVNDARELADTVTRIRPGLLLLDLSMPHQNGLDLIPELLTLQPDLRIVVVTMHLDRGLADLALSRGARGFVPKESSATELNDALDRVLAGETVISSRVPRRAYREPDGDDPELDRLTPRQRQIVALIGEGRSTPDIARVLDLSPRTIEFHRSSIRRTLGITTEFGLVEFAIVSRRKRGERGEK
jgi:DNA-binding NarL/FixJ family response regulator